MLIGYGRMDCLIYIWGICLNMELLLNSVIPCLLLQLFYSCWFLHILTAMIVSVTWGLQLLVDFYFCYVFYHRPLKAFDLVKDRDTGSSKGYGFCVYQVCRSSFYDEVEV